MQGIGLEKEPWAHLPLLALFRAYSHCFQTREEQMSLRLRRRGASWYRVPPKIELHDLIFRSTVLSSPLPHSQPCASNGRLRRDEGLSTSLNSLLSTKRRRCPFRIMSSRARRFAFGQMAAKWLYAFGLWNSQSFSRALESRLLSIPRTGFFTPRPDYCGQDLQSSRERRVRYL